LLSSIFTKAIILYGINIFLLFLFIAIAFIVEKRFKTIFNH
jgi:hypothetical protein